MRHAKRSGKRARSRSACEALGGSALPCPKGGTSTGTMAELKARLKARDRERGYVPRRVPFRFGASGLKPRSDCAQQGE